MEQDQEAMELKLNEIQGAANSIFSKLLNMEEKGGRCIKAAEAQAGELAEIRKDQEHLYRCMKSFNSSVILLLKHMMELKAGVNELTGSHKHAVCNTNTTKTKQVKG